MDVNELRRILNGYFGWNKARMDCFVGMLLALTKGRTVYTLLLNGDLYDFLSCTEIKPRFQLLFINQERKIALG